MSPIHPSYLTPDYINDFSKQIDSVLSYLDLKCRNRLKSCLKKPKNLMFEDMFKHGLHLKNSTSDDYFIGLSDIKNRPQRNEIHLEELYRSSTGDKPDGFQQSSPFFANATKFPSQAHAAPSDRITNSGLYYHTFESDTVALNRQIKWTFKGNDEFECVMGKIYKRLARYDDFRGLYCTWSGNKSLHIHTMWSIKHLSDTTQIKQVPDELLRSGLIHYWGILNCKIKAAIKAEDKIRVSFDKSLRLPEQYRRLCWGQRKVEKNGELFAKGSLVPQIELWSHSRSKPSGKDKNSKGLLHQNNMFFKKFQETKQKYQHAKINVPEFQVQKEKEFIAYVSDICQMQPSNYPKPASAYQEKNGDIVISFKNGSADKNPSSIMKGNYSTISINGNPYSLTQSIYSLPFTANELWLKFNDIYIEQLFSKIKFPVGIENVFQKIRSRNTNQKSSVHEAMAVILPFIFGSAKRSAVLTPEGSGKTTALLKAIPMFVDSPIDIVAFASHSYEQAQQHCDDFNKMAANNKRLGSYKGFLLPSFSDAYNKQCTNGKYKSGDGSAKYFADGYKSLLEAVYENEKEATITELETIKINTKKAINDSGKIPVYFTVHNVIHTWHNAMGTRVWFADNFRKEFKNRGNNKSWQKNLEPIKISHVIYDELKRNDLRSQHSKYEVDFYNDVCAEGKKSRCELYEAYQNIVKSGNNSVKYQTVQEIGNIKYDKSNLVVADSENEKIGVNNSSDSIYVGKPEIYVKEKKWWKQAKDTADYNLMVLTTERSLFEILNSINKKQGDTFTLFDFEFLLPLSSNIATTEAYIARNINSANIDDFVSDFLSQHSIGTWKLISNVCKEINGVCNHSQAKGSNALTSYNIASTYMYPADVLYFELVADNIYFDIKHGVKMHMLDEFNQSVGRNLGFRYSGKQSRVYMTRRFASDFLYFFEKHSRYTIKMQGIFR